jgi:hypothetical protein
MSNWLRALIGGGLQGIETAYAERNRMAEEDIERLEPRFSAYQQNIRPQFETDADVDKFMESISGEARMPRSQRALGSMEEQLRQAVPSQAERQTALMATPNLAWMPESQVLSRMEALGMPVTPASQTITRTSPEPVDRPLPLAGGGVYRGGLTEDVAQPGLIEAQMRPPLTPVQPDTFTTGPTPGSTLAQVQAMQKEMQESTQGQYGFERRLQRDEDLADNLAEARQHYGPGGPGEMQMHAEITQQVESYNRMAPLEQKDFFIRLGMSTDDAVDQAQRLAVMNEDQRMKTLYPRLMEAGMLAEAQRAALQTVAYDSQGRMHIVTGPSSRVMGSPSGQLFMQRQPGSTQAVSGYQYGMTPQYVPAMEEFHNHMARAFMRAQAVGLVPNTPEHQAFLDMERENYASLQEEPERVTDESQARDYYEATLLDLGNVPARISARTAQFQPTVTGFEARTGSQFSSDVNEMLGDRASRMFDSVKPVVPQNAAVQGVEIGTALTDDQKAAVLEKLGLLLMQERQALQGVTPQTIKEFVETWFGGEGAREFLASRRDTVKTSEGQAFEEWYSR